MKEREKQKRIKNDIRKIKFKIVAESVRLASSDENKISPTILTIYQIFEHLSIILNDILATTASSFSLCAAQANATAILH